MDIVKLLNKHWELSHLSENTKLRIRSNVLDYSNSMKVYRTTRMTTDSVLLWGSRKLSNGRRTSTVSACYNSIRSFARFAESHGYEIDIDEKLVRCSPQYRSRRALTPAQIRRVISFADPQTASLIRLAYMCGLRRSEALSVTVEMIRTSITGVMYITGKGNKSRPVFLTPALQEELMFIEKEGPCFPISADLAYTRVKQAMVDSGYPWANFHTLRHSFATTLITRGADISKVSRMMGHENIATTQIYVHTITADIQKAHRKYIVQV